MPEYEFIVGLSQLVEQHGSASGGGDQDETEQAPVCSDVEALLAHNQKLAITGQLNDSNKYRTQNIHGESAWFSNEYDYDATLDILGRIPSRKSTVQHNVGFIAGESHFLSSLPEFARHTDTIVFTDVDAHVLAENMYQLACFRKASNFMEFMAMLALPVNPCTTLARLPALNVVREGFLASIERLGARHAIMSPARFAEAKAALQQLNFMALPIDLMDRWAVARLQAVVRKTECNVTLMNLSNIHHYDVHASGQPLTRYARHIQAGLTFKRKGILDAATETLASNETLMLFSVVDQWGGESRKFLNPGLSSQLAISHEAYRQRITAEEIRVNCAIRLSSDMFQLKSLDGTVQSNTRVTRLLDQRQQEMNALVARGAMPVDEGQMAGCTTPPGSYKDQDGRTVVTYR